MKVYHKSILKYKTVLYTEIMKLFSITVKALFSKKLCLYEESLVSHETEHFILWR